MKPLGDHHGGVGQVVLLGLSIEQRGDGKVTTQFTVKDANEDRGGVEVRIAEAVDRAILADESSSVHVSNESIVFSVVMCVCVCAYWKAKKAVTSSLALGLVARVYPQNRT